MARRIEAHQSMQLTLPEGSTVIVIPQKGGRVDPKDVAKRYPVEPTIEPVRIRSIIQDYIQFGPEEIDINGNFTAIRILMEQACARGFTIKELEQDIETVLAETRNKLEGRKMGYSPTLIADVKSLLMETAEDVWTTPQN